MNKEIPCHKIYLALYSKYFHKILQNPVTNIESIIIDKVDKLGIEIIIHYIYYQKPSNKLDFCRASQINALHELCIKWGLVDLSKYLQVRYMIKVNAELNGFLDSNKNIVAFNFVFRNSWGGTKYQVE